jgi:hypothetical protein
MLSNFRSPFRRNTTLRCIKIKVQSIKLLERAGDTAHITRRGKPVDPDHGDLGCFSPTLRALSDCFALVINLLVAGQKFSALAPKGTLARGI